MVTVKEGSLSLNFGLVKLETKLSDEDRQCAWELYTELSTRVAVIGKSSYSDHQSFEGELLIESLQSLYAFFQETRLIMRKFPVGKITVNNKNHLGTLSLEILCKCLRPFLEKWQVDFRHWWEHQSNPGLAPLDRQKEYPNMKDFLDDWSDVRNEMCEFKKVLITVYELVDVDTE